MKRNKLYTVNKWNAPLFVSDDKNTFAFGGGTDWQFYYSTPTSTSSAPISSSDYLRNLGVAGQAAPAPVVGNNGLSYTPYKGTYNIYQPIQKSTNINTSLEGTNINPTGKQKFKGTMTNVKNKLNSAFQKGGAGWMAAGAAAGVAGQIGNDPRGMWDTLDPWYHVADGRESKVGNAMSDAGVGLTQAGLSSGNPSLMFAGAIVKSLGGIYNAAAGIKTNKERLNAVNQGIASNKNFTSNAQDWDELRGHDSAVTNTDIYEGGWLKGSHKSAKGKNARLGEEVADALSWADRSIDNNMYNIADDYMNNYLASYHAFGGPLGEYTPAINGAIDYGFMSDYLLAKKKQADAKDVGKNLLAGMPNNAFAEGGNIEIKHPGRLTELKKRTGKTEAELWSEGNPDVRKMITLNHGYPTKYRNMHGYNWYEGSDIRPYDAVLGPNSEGEYKADYYGSDNEYWLTKGQLDSLITGNRLKRKYQNFQNTFNEAAEKNRKLLQNGVIGKDGKIKEIPKMTKKLANKIANTKADGGFLDTSNLLALGGDVQTHGADFTTGMTHVNAGGSHEENPYEGVQFGVDSEGKPNLVEEGETVYNDYVFSTRIFADAETKKKFRLPKKQDITFADISKKLEKEASERPNDPISQDALDKQLAKLASEQERQKEEMEAAQAREAFESLTPEEQVGLMQYAAQQEAMAQQPQQEMMQAPEQAGYAMEEPAYYNENPEFMSPQMSAFGGLLNRYDGGGMLKKQIYSQLGVANDDAFDLWAKNNGLSITAADLKDDAAWSNYLQNEDFLNILGKDRSALAHAIRTGKYDFGLYKPDNADKVIIDINRGGRWGSATSTGRAWNAGTDPKDIAFLQATGNLSPKQINALTSKQLADLMRETEAYKKGTDWLRESEDNRLKYLTAVMNDKNSPEKAKRFASQFITPDGKWKDGIDRSYERTIQSAREDNYPGTYWYTPLAALRNKTVSNYVLNDKGEWELMTEAVPTDWKAQNTYSWDTKDGGLTYNYYVRPAAEGAAGVAGTGAGAVAGGNADGAKEVDPAKVKKLEEQLRTIALKRRPEWYRTAGAAFPFVGLGLWGANVGRPDKSGLDAALEISANQPGAMVPYKGVHNYLAPRKYDLWFEQNRQNANARATDAAIMNSSLPQSSRAAAQVANGYNALIADADLHQKAMAYNDALDEKKETFNRDTNKFNAEAFNKAMMTEAEQQGRNWQYRGNLAADIAKAKMEADAGWYNGLYGGLTALGNNLIGIGTENFRMNRIGEMAANGLFGNMSKNTPILDIYVDKEKSAAYGGKIKKRKKGLTY